MSFHLLCTIRKFIPRLFSRSLIVHQSYFERRVERIQIFYCIPLYFLFFILLKNNSILFLKV